jgi:hypothetical protein
VSLNIDDIDTENVWFEVIMIDARAYFARTNTYNVTNANQEEANRRGGEGCQQDWVWNAAEYHQAT